MAVLGGRLLGSLGRRSADAAPQTPFPAAKPAFRPPFRRPPALDILTSSDSIELDDTITALVGAESSDESGDGRSGETSYFAKSDSSDSVACDSCGRSPISSDSSARERLRNGNQAVKLKRTAAPAGNRWSVAERARGSANADASHSLLTTTVRDSLPPPTSPASAQRSHRRAESAEVGSVVPQLVEGGLSHRGLGSCESLTAKKITAASLDPSVSAVAAGQCGRRDGNRASGRATADSRDYPITEDTTPPSPASERFPPSPHRPPPSPHRPPPSPHRPRGAFVAFVGGSFRGAAERTMSEDKQCPARANTRPRSGGRGMRSLSRGSSSSTIHHVRRNSTGAHAAGFDGGRPMVRANSSNSSDNLRSLQSPGIADRSPSSPFEALQKAERSPSSPSPHDIHAAETAAVSGSFSFCSGGSSSRSSRRGGSSPLWFHNSSSTAGGWGVGSIFRSLHAPVSPIFRPKRPTANPWDHPAASPETGAFAIGTSSDVGFNGASNGAGSTATKPPKHHLWAGSILPAARPHRIKSLNSFPSSTSLNQMPARASAALTSMRVPACPSVPEPSLEAPPLLRRSRTEGTCETSAAFDDAASHLEVAATHAAFNDSNEGHIRPDCRASRAASHEASAASAAFKGSGRRRTLRGDSCGSFSEGCIPLVPDAAGSMTTTTSKGSTPHFVPATEHRLFSGLDNDPPRFRHRSSMSFSQLQHLLMEMPAQPEPVQKLPLQKLRAQRLQTQELPTQPNPSQQLPTQPIPSQQLPTQPIPSQQLTTEHLPMQHPPAQKLAAPAEVAGAGKGMARAPSAFKCDLPLHASPAAKGTGRQESKSEQVNNEPSLERTGDQHQEDLVFLQSPISPPMPRQTHRRRIRRVGSEPGLWEERRSEVDKGWGRRSREQEMVEGAVESSDMIVRSPDSGWCKVGGLHSWSPEHGEGDMPSSGGRVSTTDGGGSCHRQRGAMGFMVTRTAMSAAGGQRHVGMNSRNVQSEPALHVTEAVSEAARPPAACDDISSSSANRFPCKNRGSERRQVMSLCLTCEDVRKEEVQSVQPMGSSLFLESGVCQNWRPAMNHPLFSGRAVGAGDYLFSP